MDLNRLREDHQALLSRADILADVARLLTTTSDADRAVAAIADLDNLIVAHLEAEDVDLYGLLMASPDRGLSEAATVAYDNVGGLVGAWSQFAGYWTPPEMLARPESFAKAAECVRHALILRVQFEEETLYPAAESALRMTSAHQAA